VKSEQCEQCGEWAEPPCEHTISWYAPATASGIKTLLPGDDREMVRIERPLCRYCANAFPHGADGLTDEGKDALDISDES
jgi:hypothetical protein